MPLGIDDLILELLAKRVGFCVEKNFRCDSCRGHDPQRRERDPDSNGRPLMQRRENMLQIGDTLLVVVDLQEAFRPAIFEFDKIIARTAIVIEAAKLLRLPIMVTEQAPTKLGATVDEIKRRLPENVTPIAKTAFSDLRRRIHRRVS